MTEPRFSREEFERLFAGEFSSPEELQREYAAFLAIVEQLDRAQTPELSAGQKAEIFRRAWRPARPQRSWAWAWLSWLRQPAVTFALGLVLGGAAMTVGFKSQSDEIQQTAAEPSFAVERTPYTQTYTGKVLQELYPQIENPKMVVERKQEAGTPQRVLYGTLDKGEIYVVWNL